MYLKWNQIWLPQKRKYFKDIVIDIYTGKSCDTSFDTNILFPFNRECYAWMQVDIDPLTSFEMKGKYFKNIHVMI